jgi:cyclic pyranopterin phosphate synthase
MKSKRLTHLTPGNRPTMVDVGAKTATFREASAEALVKLPAAVARELARTGHRTKKGPVFDTAIVAGVMAAKKTHEIIPFCHPLPLERCAIDIATRSGGLIRIVCNVAVHHKTGVEMEALVGASAAALTIYDMCKALSHDIEIGPVRLIAKSGGKRDFQREKSMSRKPAPRKSAETRR